MAFEPERPVKPGPETLDPNRKPGTDRPLGGEAGRDYAPGVTPGVTPGSSPYGSTTGPGREYAPYPSDRQMDKGERTTDKAHETVERTADKVQGAVDIAVDKAHDTIEGMREQGAALREQARGAGQQAMSRANEVTDKVGEKLTDVAQGLRERAPTGGTVGSLAEGAADRLERAGTYLQEQELSEMRDDLARFIRRYPFQTLLAGVGLGFLLARNARRY